MRPWENGGAHRRSPSSMHIARQSSITDELAACLGEKTPVMTMYGNVMRYQSQGRQFGYNGKTMVVMPCLSFSAMGTMPKCYCQHCQRIQVTNPDNKLELLDKPSNVGVRSRGRASGGPRACLCCGARRRRWAGDGPAGVGACCPGGC